MTTTYTVKISVNGKVMGITSPNKEFVERVAKMWEAANPNRPVYRFVNEKSK